MPKKLTIEDMQAIAKRHGGKCVSNQYVNSYTPLKWQCKNGHKWMMKPNNAKNLKVWCQECATEDIWADVTQL
ncbi:MAG: hypothetical protein MK116_11505, partial [Phycisphaerales bacterium]|nr:hypothetical protein [Phycisphaerales bacterium]